MAYRNWRSLGYIYASEPLAGGKRQTALTAYTGYRFRLVLCWDGESNRVVVNGLD